ncbi:Putative LOC100121136, partial [Caligus rogercresseyi]
VILWNGQSFLFRLSPDFQVWPWSTENDFFISCSLTTLRIGAGDGHFGISLDSDLNMGRSQRCATYNNDPLVPSEDFIIKTLRSGLSPPKSMMSCVPLTTLQSHC